MPTALRVDGFRIAIFLPPREHGPPHVHVQAAGGEAVIELAVDDSPQTVRTVSGLRSAQIVRAFRIVEANTATLLEHWRRYHD